MYYKIICPVCKREGRKSKVYDKGCSITMLGSESYCDEEGEFHKHNPNKIRTMYRCDNGHVFEVTFGFKCPSCDFGSEDPVFNILVDKPD